MGNINIVDQIKSMMPFEFVELDQICDKPRCENKITGVKYPNEQPRLMNHHNVKFDFGETKYYLVKLTMCTPCMLKGDDKYRADESEEFGFMPKEENII